MVRVRIADVAVSDFLQFMCRIPFADGVETTYGANLIIRTDTQTGHVSSFRGTFTYDNDGFLASADIRTVVLSDSNGMVARIDGFTDDEGATFLQAVSAVQAGVIDRPPSIQSRVLFRDIETVFFTGNNGDDTAFTGRGADTLFGGAGDDSLYGSFGGNLLNGGSGNDTLGSDLGADTLLGTQGWDAVSYEYATAAVIADLGNPAGNTGAAVGDLYASIEALIGTAFADRLSGRGDANQLTGGDGRDTLAGRAGGDTLLGGDGADQLLGGLGNDLLTGGTGQDRFRFLSDTEGADTITDFEPGLDRLQIIASGFGGSLVAGQALEEGVDFFVDVPSASPEAGYFLFVTATSQLLWDRDGSGAGEAVVILTTPGAGLSASDILIQ